MDHHTPTPPTRRTVLDWAIHGLGTVFAAVLACPIIAYVIDPRNRPARAGDFTTVDRRFSDLPSGVPVQAVIRDVKRDAWTLYPNEVVGRVWLIRRNEETVEAFTTICPHLGCSINYDGTNFVCPCHNGTFHVSGKCVTNEELGFKNPAPRGMDSLEVRREDDVVLVKYQNFQQGKHDKVLKT